MTGLSLSQWRAWLISEYQCQVAEVAAFAMIAARCSHHTQAASFFTNIADQLLRGRPTVLAAAAALDIDERELAQAPLRPGVHEFTGFVSWLALHGTIGETALVVRHDWILYCAACAALADAVSPQVSGPPPIVLRYLKGYASPPQQVLDAARALVDQALRDGEPEAQVTRSVSLTAITLEGFWRAVLAA